GAGGVGADADDALADRLAVEHGVELDHPVNVRQRDAQRLADGLKCRGGQVAVNLLRIVKSREKIGAAAALVLFQNGCERRQIKSAVQDHGFSFECCTRLPAAAMDSPGGGPMAWVILAHLPGTGY